MRPDAVASMEGSDGEFDVDPSEIEARAEDALERTVLHQDLETRVETFDEERVARSALEPREVAHTVDEFSAHGAGPVRREEEEEVGLP
jgi:hypothetical protein